MQKILVTGASGLLGTTLALVARRAASEVIGVTFRHPLNAQGATSLVADLTDKAEVERVMLMAQPEWIIHCAAMTDVDWCEDHRAEARTANVDMTRNLAAAARQCGAGFLYVSTDSVFDGERGDYGEQDQPNPVNRYAETKLEGERVAQEETGNCLIARMSFYGWNHSFQPKQSLAEWILANLKEGRSMPGFRDVVFTPLCATDLSEILLSMVNLRLSGIYHVGSCQGCSKYEFAIALAQAFHRDTSLVEPAMLGDVPLRASRPKNTSLRTAKLSGALGRAMPDLKSGILRFMAERVSHSD